MDEGGDPPDRGQISTLVKTVQHQDFYRNVFRPDKEKGEIAYCNMDVCDTLTPRGYAFTVRVRTHDDNKYKESSRVDAGFLQEDLKTIEGLKTVAYKEGDHAPWGIEDMRIKMGPDGNFHMTGTASDGRNPRTVYFIASPDLKDTGYQGIIGPQITQKRALQILGKKSPLSIILQNNINASERAGRSDALLGDKDTSPFFYNRDIGFFARKLNCVNYHKAREDSDKTNTKPLTHYEITDTFNELKRTGWWENEIENSRDNVIMTPEAGWEKIGIGTAPNSNGIGSCHRVFKEKVGSINIYTYVGSLFKFDPVKKKVVARLRDALFLPRPQDVLKEYDKNGRLKTIKYVAFPMGLVEDPKNENTTVVFLGAGDKLTDSRSFDSYWSNTELAHQHNKEHLMDLLQRTYPR